MSQIIQKAATPLWPMPNIQPSFKKVVTYGCKKKPRHSKLFMITVWFYLNYIIYIYIYILNIYLYLYRWTSHLSMGYFLPFAPAWRWTGPRHYRLIPILRASGRQDDRWTWAIKGLKGTYVKVNGRDISWDISIIRGWSSDPQHFANLLKSRCVHIKSMLDQARLKTPDVLWLTLYQINS